MLNLLQSQLDFQLFMPTYDWTFDLKSMLAYFGMSMEYFDSSESLPLSLSPISQKNCVSSIDVSWICPCNREALVRRSIKSSLFRVVRRTDPDWEIGQFWSCRCRSRRNPVNVRSVAETFGRMFINYSRLTCIPELEFENWLFARFVHWLAEWSPSWCCLWRGFRFVQGPPARNATDCLAENRTPGTWTRWTGMQVLFFIVPLWLEAQENMKRFQVGGRKIIW